MPPEKDKTPPPPEAVAVTPSQAVCEFDTEVRIAVVMYGGISLAIYMNGVAQELLNLVLATAPEEAPITRKLAPDKGKPLYAWIDDGRATGTVGIYRKLARMMANQRTTVPAPEPLRFRFVVDILSGTSAGGLNGLFLAKALVGEHKLDPLQALWVTEGEITQLINDAKSYDDLKGLRPQGAPTSLLNSERMYAKLLQALDGMERTAAYGPVATRTGPSRLVDELDLYMTATDLDGLSQPIYLPSGNAAPPAGLKPADVAKLNRFSDLDSLHGKHVIHERRHKASFHFRYVNPDIEVTLDAKGAPTDIDDFVPENSPFLAFVARSTSSIVPAFEPMRLLDTKRVLDSRDNPSPVKYQYDFKKWQHLYRDFWRHSYLYRSDMEPDRAIERAIEAFPGRAFGDGGYLDNRPFTYATETLSQRRADLAVKRLLLYVEPDPDRYSSFMTSGDLRPDRPNVLEHAKAAASLPAKETIREDMARLRERNKVIGHAERVFQAFQDSERQPARIGLEGDGEGMASQIPYLRLRVIATTDALAETLRRTLNLEPDTPYSAALVYIVRAWRDEAFGSLHPSTSESESGDKPLPIGFLKEFDVAFRLRRHEFVQHRLEEEIRKPQEEESKTAFRLRKQELNIGFLRDLVVVPRLVLVRRATLAAGRKESLSGDFGDAGQQLELAIAQTLLKLQINLRELGYILEGKEASHAFIGDRNDKEAKSRLQRARIVLGYEATPPPKKSLIERVKGYQELLDATEAVRKERPELLRQLRNHLRDRLDLTEWDVRFEKETQGGEALNSTNPSDAATRVAAREFFSYDALTYPVFFGNAASETRRVDIVRVSPLDATTLIDDEEERRGKLAGVGMAHFGAFFDPCWRRMDIVWGRLDASERLLCSLLEQSSERRELILEAQLAILAEAMTWFEKDFQALQGRGKSGKEHENEEARLKFARQELGRLSALVWERYATEEDTDA
ncbi:DUF3376 domain-containing protein [bacterium]|nr:MAG: DUF3376 domain-containing protein [bacterium]